MSPQFSVSQFNLLTACLIISFFLNLPSLFVQHGFTAGDVGANLYVFEAMCRGEIPYKDFFWPYGPIMLYYNVLFFKLFGHNIHSVIWARILLKTLFSGVFFLAAKRIMPAWGSLLASLAFTVFTPDFEHNFSHYGGVCFEVGILWSVLSYYQNPQNKYALWAWVFVLLLGFDKINFGIMFLGGTPLCFVLCDLFGHKKSFSRIPQYALLCLSVVLLWAFVHFFYLRTLTLNEIGQCFPIFPPYCYFGGSVSNGFIQIYKDSMGLIHQNNINAIIAGLALLSSLRLTLHMILNRSWRIGKERNVILIILILSIFAVLSYHEFLKGRLDYQAFWAKPFTVMINSFLICEACMACGPVIQIEVFLIASALIAAQAHNNWGFLEHFKNKQHFFNHKNINIYVTADPKDIKTMLDVTDYIEKNIPPNVPFYVFPSGPIYYFLTDHHAPYRLLHFFKGTNIPPEQELELIKNLEKKSSEYIILQKVAYFGNIYGVLGQNFGFLMAKYMKKYFHEVASFGTSPTHNWEGVIILKKISPETHNIQSPMDLN